MMQLTATASSLFDLAVSSCGSDPFQPVFDVAGAIGWLLVVGLLLSRHRQAAQAQAVESRREPSRPQPRPQPVRAQPESIRPQPPSLHLVKDRPRGLIPQRRAYAM